MYILNCDKLKKGDIILSYSNERFDENLRLRYKMPYSHAMLYVGNSSIIHSNVHGVESLNPQRISYPSLDNVAVYRLKEENIQAIEVAIQFARLSIATEYSSIEMKKSANDTGKAIEPNKQFCTRFIAQAFEAGGILLSNKVDYCSPNDILNSDKLIKVKQPLKKASNQELELITENGLTDKQTVIRDAIFSHARKVTGEDVQNFQQLSEYLVYNRERVEIIDKITDNLKTSGHLTTWKEEKNNNPHFYNISDFVKTVPMLSWKEVGLFLSKDENVRERYLQMREALISFNQYSQLEFFELLIELYNKLIELSNQREHIGKTVLHMLKEK
jgi:hypothetical protein